MRKTLEDFYYGNITPCERQMAPGTELKRAADRVAHYESQLSEQLNVKCTPSQGQTESMP